MASDETKAALNSETGAFSWQSGDVISVLATDGKFYDFTLSEGNGEQTAEFVGRIPITVGLHPLDESALVNIMTKPKNALIKQYKRLIGIDNVELEITDGAISAVAKRAIELKTGARGLRTILENLMIDTMYDLPSIEDIQKVVVDEAVVTNGAKPTLIKKEIA